MRDRFGSAATRLFKFKFSQRPETRPIGIGTRIIPTEKITWSLAATCHIFTVFNLNCSSKLVVSLSTEIRSRMCSRSRNRIQKICILSLRCFIFHYIKSLEAFWKFCRYSSFLITLVYEGLRMIIKFLTIWSNRNGLMLRSHCPEANRPAIFIRFK